MEAYYSTPDGLQIMQGHVLAVLRELPSESVHVVCTSPPYYGLRSYAGIDPQVWDDPGGCEHEWGDDLPSPANKRGNKPGDVASSTLTNPQRQDGIERAETAGQFCQRCSAWRGHLGLEPTCDLYIRHLVSIFREVKRVLRSDGSFWCNVGDSFSGGGHGPTGNGSCLGKNGRADYEERQGFVNRQTTGGDIPAKNLMLVPGKLAEALQADGWTVRSMSPWLKRACMPESTSDRWTSALEWVIHLVKSDRYFFDAEAVKAEHRVAPHAHGRSKHRHLVGPFQSGCADAAAREPDRVWAENGGRNRRNSDAWFESLDWQIASLQAEVARLQAMRQDGGALFEDDTLVAIDQTSEPLKANHYAAFPSGLVRPLVLASTSERGCCPKCGVQYERMVERRESTYRTLGKTGREDFGRGDSQPGNAGQTRYPNGKVATLQPSAIGTLGWKPGCSCQAGEPIGATILDPFLGSGTTLLVARQLGRRGVGIELSKTYIDEIAIPRLEGQPMSLFAEVP